MDWSAGDVTPTIGGVPISPIPPMAAGFAPTPPKAHPFGFAPVEGWRLVYWDAVHKLLLIVYVDDFKLAGPKNSLPEILALIRKGLHMEPPTKVGSFLGCNHLREEIGCLTESRQYR